VTAVNPHEPYFDAEHDRLYHPDRYALMQKIRRDMDLEKQEQDRKDRIEWQEFQAEREQSKKIGNVLAVIGVLGVAGLIAYSYKKARQP
jgi:hypothetical protein